MKPGDRVQLLHNDLIFTYADEQAVANSNPNGICIALEGLTATVEDVLLGGGGGFNVVYTARPDALEGFIAPVEGEEPPSDYSHTYLYLIDPDVIVL